MKTFEILTLFPQAFPGTLDLSILKKAKEKYWNLKVHDLRSFGIGKHKIVDDTVFGGIPGMLIRPDVIENAMNNIKFSGKKIYLTPRGKLLNQKMIEEMANKYENILILCGRYEGIDQRAIEYYNFEEISIGNYVLAGAEVAALVMMEAIIRKLDGVIGNKESFAQETFVNNEISEPRYTKPAQWEPEEGKILKVDDVLISGNHEKIKLFQKSKRKSIIEEEKQGE